MVFWKWPEKTFALFPFVLPLYVLRTHIGPLPTTGLELIIIATAIAWIAKGAKRKNFLLETRETIRSWKWPMFLWLAAGLVGIFVASDPIAALGLYRAYFIEPVFIFVIGLGMCRHANTPKEQNIPAVCPNGMMTSFAVVLMGLGLYAIVQYVTGWGIPHPWDAVAGRRAVGPFPYPNALSLFVTPVAALLFADVLKRISKGLATRQAYISVLISFAGFLFGTIAIVLAKSDGGMIALSAAIVVAALFYKRIRLIAIGLMLLGIVAMAGIAPIRHKIIDTVTFREWSGMVRTVIWKESITMLKDHPVFGAGLGGYPTAIQPYHKATWMEIFQYPHTIVLNLWSETGLLGILAFGFIIGRWIQGDYPSDKHAKREQRLLRKREFLPYILPVVLALLVQGLVDVPYFKNDLAVAFWLLVLLTTHMYEIKNSH